VEKWKIGKIERWRNGKMEFENMIIQMDGLSPFGDLEMKKLEVGRTRGSIRKAG